MQTLPSLPQTATSFRIATALITALICIGAPLQTATAADALTTSSTSTTSSSGTTQLERSILGLPIGILKSLYTGVTKAASNTVTKHIRKN